MKQKYDEKLYGYLVKLRDKFAYAEPAEYYWKRLYHCNAHYYEEKSGYIWLKSYNTIVAVYNPNDRVLYSYGRYSATTYKQVYKFRNWLWDNKYPKYDAPWDMPMVNIWYEDLWGCFTPYYY